MISSRFSIRMTLACLLGLVVFTGLATIPGNAVADTEQYLELVRQDLVTTKVAYMTEGMDLTDEQGTIFWPIYREYLTKLSAIGDRRLENIKDYASHFEAMTDEKASEILKNSFKMRKDYNSLLEKTAKNVSKELDPITAARFVQVENTLNLLIDLQLAGEIPLFEKSAE